MRAPARENKMKRRPLFGAVVGTAPGLLGRLGGTFWGRGAFLGTAEGVTEVALIGSRFGLEFLAAFLTHHLGDGRQREPGDMIC